PPPHGAYPKAKGYSRSIAGLGEARSTSGRVKSFGATAQDRTLDDNWVLWLRLPRRKKPIRSPLALEALGVFIEQLDIVLALSGPQHVLAGEAIDDDVRLHLARIVDCHPTEGQRCAFGVYRGS